jgi:hypothetical protein
MLVVNKSVNKQSIIFTHQYNNLTIMSSISWFTASINSQLWYWFYLCHLFFYSWISFSIIILRSFVSTRFRRCLCLTLFQNKSSRWFLKISIIETNNSWSSRRLRLEMSRFESIPVRVLSHWFPLSKEPTQCRFDSIRFRVSAIQTRVTKDTKAFEIVFEMRN